MSGDATFADETVLSRAQVAWLLVTVGWVVVTVVWFANGNIVGWIGALLAIGSAYQMLRAG